MIRTTKFSPRIVPYLNTNSSNQIDRLQDMTTSVTFNRTKIEEIGRDGIVDWRTGNPAITVTLKQLEYGSMQFWQDLRNTGSSDTKIEFNEKAGITHSMNDVPEFFREEPSEPTGLKYTFSKDDLKSFWDKLKE